MTVQIAKHLFDVREYHRLAQAGIFAEDDRVELINGEVVEMSPIGSAHAACVSRLEALLHESVGHIVQIRVQNPVLLDDYSEPEPDITLVKTREDFYVRAHPKPEDILLVVEVADTSIDYDRLIKLPLYARAGIPAAWLVDLTQELVRVFSGPREGKYQNYREFKRGETITLKGVPELTLSAEDLLG
jgi:Uma2 family endonuclease